MALAVGGPVPREHAHRTVDMLHGCAARWAAGVDSLRNYVGEDALIAFLRDRLEAYGPLGEEGRHAALTVDDTTIGAARSCLLAREAGHDVTLFVNPWQVISGRCYWFSRLDAILDATRARVVEFAGESYVLDRNGGTRALRLAMKARLMPLPEAETDALLDAIARALGVGAVEVPEHARTIGLANLRALVAAGVRIGNHGWDHRDIGALEDAALAADLDASADWLEDNLGVAARDYAVPYGLARLPAGLSGRLPAMVLLTDPALPAGAVAGWHWNRRDITRDVRNAIA